MSRKLRNESVSPMKKKIMLFIWIRAVVLGWFCILLVNPLSLTPSLDLQFRPSRVELLSVTQSYPPTLFRTLFSSVPKREHAVYNISFVAQAEMILLLGASSSGKSALMKLVSETETPVSGRVVLKGARPVYLDQKPSSDSQNTLCEILQQIVGKYCDLHNNLGSCVRDKICYLLLEDTDMSKKPLELSPSERYRFGLACASLHSMLPSLDFEADDCHATIPAPVLLLDEWMDVEASSVVRRIEERALSSLVQCGAVIFCATHKPQLFAQSYRAITLCRGEVLSETRAV